MLQRIVAGRQIWILALITVAIWLLFTTIDPNFANPKFSTFPLLRDTATFAIVGFAQMVALSIGHMNLAVGRMAAVAAMVAGMSFQYLGAGLLVGTLLGLIASGLVGMLTGAIIVVSKVNSFIVTLAMDFMLVGFVALMYTNLTSAAAFTAKPGGMAALGRGSFADYCLVGGLVCGPNFLPLLVVPAVVVAAVIGWMYRRARLGRELIAIGNSMVVSKASGIAINRRVVETHMISGVLAGLAGIMVVVSNGSATASIGSEFMIPSFLGPLLGGTNLLGGAVSVVGAVLGTLLTFVLRSGLTTLGLGLETLNMALGGLLLVVLALQGAGTLRQWFRRTKQVVRT